MDKLKEIIRKRLKEMSATGMGGATFSAGQGMNYATPKAFKKTKSIEEGPGATLGMGPSAGAEGVKDNAYVKQFKYKLVPKKIKGSGLEVKQLWEEEKELTDVEKFQQERIDEFDQIQDELNKLISNAKNQTIEYYQANPGKFSIYKPTSMALEYIKKAQKLLSK
jgi:hypothetical protein